MNNTTIKQLQRAICEGLYYVDDVEYLRQIFQLVSKYKKPLDK